MMRKDKAPVDELPPDGGELRHAGGPHMVGWLQGSTMISDKVGVCFMVHQAGNWTALTEDVFEKLPETARCTIYNSANSWRRHYEEIVKDPITTIEWFGAGQQCDLPDYVFDARDACRPMTAVDVLRNRKRAAAALGINPLHRPRMAGGGTVLDSDAEAKALLAAASERAGRHDDEAPLRRKALELLGLAGHAAPIGTTEQLIEAIAEGFPSSVLAALRSAGWTYELMEKVIGPRRTLMRRKSAGHRLTPAESDAAWRLGYALAAASVVFASREAALAWLMRPKRALRDRSPAELLQSSVGTEHILSMLRRIDRGDFV